MPKLSVTAHLIKEIIQTLIASKEVRSLGNVELSLQTLTQYLLKPKIYRMSVKIVKKNFLIIGKFSTKEIPAQHLSCLKV